MASWMKNTTPKTMTQCEINLHDVILNSSRRLGQQTKNNLRNSHIPAIVPTLPLSLSFALDMYQMIDAIFHKYATTSAPDIHQFLRG